MKHGLKQEIKRGLSVLMAVSMVASSALPVMAEEVVEEAVEVEVVSEEVADEAGDVVVDVADVEDVEEEVVEDVVVDEAADDVTGGTTPVVPEHTTHTRKNIVEYKYGAPDKDGKVKLTVWYSCTGCDKIFSTTLTTPNGSWVVDSTVGVGFKGSVSKAPDCEKETDGSATYVIQLSDDTYTKDVYTDTLPIKWAHTPDTTKNVTIVPATCTEAGHKTYECSECHKGIENEVIPAVGHDYSIDLTETKWSTDGKAATVVARCGNDSKHNVELDISKYIKQDEENYVKPTCDTYGSVVYRVYLSDEQATKLLGVDDPSSVSVTGSMTNSSGTYYAKKTVQLEKTKHDITSMEFTFSGTAKDSVDCSVTYTCKNCNSVDQGEVKVLPQENKTVKTTCKTDGKYYFYATYKLGDTTYSSLDYNTEWIVSETHNNNAHSWSVRDDRKPEDAYEVGLAPTCENTGTGYFACKYCGEKSGNKIIPALGHDFGETKGEVVNKEATCVSDGRLFAECKRCGKTTANNNVWNSLETEQQALFTTKKAHKFEITDVEWSSSKQMVIVTATCKCGATTHDADALVSKTLKAEEKIDVPATGTTDGKKHYEATLKFEDCNKKTWEFVVKSDSVVVPATGITELELGDITTTYTGDRIAAPFVKNNRVASEVEVKYYKDKELTQQYSGAPYTAGTYYAKATAIKTDKMTAAESNVATVTILKADPTVTVKASKTSVKNTKKNTVNITVSQKNRGGQAGKVTFTAPSKKISVNSKGVVTIKKGTKKGTYKVIVNVKATTNFNAYTETIKITVK